MAGTASDVLVLLDALRTGNGVLRTETAALARQNHVGALAEAALGHGWGWGLVGQSLVDPAAAASPQSPGTVAWGGAYGHSWFVDASRELTVVALTNTALSGMWGAFRRPSATPCTPACAAPTPHGR